MNLSSEREHEIAIHEAGHAVVATALGIPVVKMTFAADDQGNSLAQTETSDPKWDEFTAPLTSPVRDRLERDVMIGMAGGMAQQRVNANSMRIAADALRDETDLNNRVARLAGNPTQEADYFARLSARVNEILMDSSWWCAVEALADRFVVTHALLGSSVNGIIATARKELKEGNGPRE